MTEQKKSLVKMPYALQKFDPKARKELVVRGLNALSEVMDAEFYFFKGEEHRLHDEYKLAISYYERALQIDPEHEESLFWVAYCYVDKKEGIGNDLELSETDMAKKAFSSLQKLIGILEKKDHIWWGDSAVYNNLGCAQYLLGLYEEAIENYEKAIELNPDDASAYYNLGIALYQLGLHKEAIKNYKKAIELNPDNGDYYFNLGFAQRELGLNEEEIENFKKAIKLNPNKPGYFFNLAKAQYKLGLHKEAKESLRIAKELIPD